MNLALPAIVEFRGGPWDGHRQTVMPLHFLRLAEDAQVFEAHPGPEDVAPGIALYYRTEERTRDGLLIYRWKNK